MDAVTTKQIADRVGKSEQYVRRVLAKLERMRLVTREGERGGWRLSTHPPIALAQRGGPAAGPGEQRQLSTRKGLER